MHPHLKPEGNREVLPKIIEAEVFGKRLACVWRSRTSLLGLFGFFNPCFNGKKRLRSHSRGFDFVPSLTPRVGVTARY